MDISAQQFTIIGQMIEPFTQSLSPEQNTELANLKAPPDVQAKLDALAAKCNEDDLTEAERAEYEALVRAGNVLNVIKAKAKQAAAGS